MPSDWAAIAALAIQIPFVLLMAYILDRQAKLGAEIAKFLMLEFKDINEKQAARHQAVTDSLLGLVDEMSARANPDKISSQQIKMIEQYLKSQGER